MENIEDKLFVALDIEKPAEAPAPAEDNHDQADTATTDDTAKPATEKSDKAPASSADGKVEQSKEERARYAAQRREAEKDAAVQAAREEERAAAKTKQDELVKSLDLKDPFNANRPIETQEQYEAYKKRAREQQLERNLRSGKLTREDLDEAISEHPVVKEAQESTASRKRQISDQVRAEAERQIAEISALDPDIKTIQDILASEKADEFRERTRRGMNLVEAYKITYEEKLERIRTQRARQEAANLQGSKGHLRTTTSKGEVDAEVPREEMQMFRAFNPNATDEEIRKFYNSRKQ